MDTDSAMGDQLLKIITNVIEELNETRDEKIPLQNLPALALYGDTGVFDSMHLVSFLSLVEEALEDELDVEVSLTSERAVSKRVSPFSRVSRLIDFIQEEIERPEGADDPAGESAEGAPSEVA
jgi:acyl carrier protein